MIAVLQTSAIQHRSFRVIRGTNLFNWRIVMPRGRPRKNTDDMLMKSAEVIGWALGGLEREIAMTRERLSSLTAQASSLRSRLSGSAGAVAPTSTAGAAADGRARKRRK